MDEIMFMAEYTARTHLSEKAANVLIQTRKVIKSCVTDGQLENAYKWAVQVISNQYTQPANNFLGAPLLDKRDYIMAIASIEETYRCQKLEIERAKLTRGDAFFIQEIINDLERNGYQHGGKAQTMLRDWSGELKEKSGLKGKRKKAFLNEVGRGNW